ncbi:MAG TPA: hypothetical protein VGC80_00725 [Acetobacteraceae bacterium]|jgi:hypothetical protein
MLTIIHHAALAGHTAALRRRRPRPGLRRWVFRLLAGIAAGLADRRRRRPNSAMLMSLDRRMLNDVGISWDDAVGVSRAGLTIRRSPLLD